MPNAAVALGLTTTVAGIVGAVGAVTAVCAIAGKANAIADAIKIFFILNLSVIIDY
jgi:hypothetical protein